MGIHARYTEGKNKTREIKHKAAGNSCINCGSDLDGKEIVCVRRGFEEVGTRRYKCNSCGREV